MLDQGNLSKSQELNILKALDGDISGDDAMKALYFESVKPSQSFEEMVDSNRVESQSDSNQFDTETGIKNSALRRQLSGAENSKEEEKLFVKLL